MTFNSQQEGLLIVIDSGSDGSGKQTQTALLYQRLINEGHRVMKVDFPNYQSDSSALVRMYLNGEFGKDAEAVNPYSASTFYAVDRFGSYQTIWKDFYLNGGIILADRYTTSNMIHQTAKFDTEEEKQAYLDWLYDLEFVKMGLPVPNQVLFLDVPVDISLQLMKERLNKINGSMTKDIHEGNEQYLRKSYENACQVAEKYGWVHIACTEGSSMKSIEDIHETIYAQLLPTLS